MFPFFTKTPGSQRQTTSHKVFETSQFDYRGHLTVENNLNVEKDAFRGDTRKYTQVRHEKIHHNFPNSATPIGALAVCTASSSFSFRNLQMNLQKKINRKSHKYVLFAGKLSSLYVQKILQPKWRTLFTKTLDNQRQTIHQKQFETKWHSRSWHEHVLLAKVVAAFSTWSLHNRLCFERETCYWLLCHNRICFVGEMRYWLLQVAKVNH